MPLDEATHNLSSELEGELRRLVLRERQRRERGEAVVYDSVSRMATWESRRGDVMGRWYGEVIATYVTADRILRWAWAGRTSLDTPSHAEVIAEQGQARGVPQLSRSLVSDLDEAESIALARLAIIVARGEGLEIRRTPNEVRFIGLFDSPRPRAAGRSGNGYSVPPPPVRPSAPPIAVASASRMTRSSSHPRSSAPSASARPASASPPPAFRSLPPIREVFEPRVTPGSTPSAAPPEPAAKTSTPAATEREVREPARALFLPVATAMLQGLNAGVPGFQQGLFTIAVHHAPPGALQQLASAAGIAGASAGAAPPRSRLVVVLVAVDSGGILRSLDPSSELVDAAARLVEADRLDGNGPWRKLTARVLPKPDGGATLNVEVI